MAKLLEEHVAASLSVVCVFIYIDLVGFENHLGAFDGDVAAEVRDLAFLHLVIGGDLVFAQCGRSGTVWFDLKVGRGQLRNLVLFDRLHRTGGGRSGLILRSAKIR